MAKRYNRLPSEILGIRDEGEYVCFCFDEACLHIADRIEKGDTFKVKTHFNSFSDMYKNLEERE